MACRLLGKASVDKCLLSQGGSTLALIVGPFTPSKGKIKKHSHGIRPLKRGVGVGGCE